MQGWLSDAIKQRQAELEQQATRRGRKARTDKCVAEHNRLVRVFRQATGQTDPHRTR